MKHHASKLKGFIWVVAAGVLAALCAAGLSPLVRTLPWSWEEKLAQHVMPVLPQNVCEFNARNEALLKRLVDRLYPLGDDDKNFSIGVQILKDPAVNAFAQLGGEISVNEGLLNEAGSPEEIAGVLAHEIEHVRRRHILEGAFIRMITSQGLHAIFSSGDPTLNTEWANYFLTMGFSRSQEAEADEGGLLRLQKAHIDNHGFQDFFRRMQKSAAAPVFISDHPSSHTRYEMAGTFKNKDVKPIMSHAEWLAFKDYCQ